MNLLPAQRNSDVFGCNHVLSQDPSACRTTFEQQLPDRGMRQQNPVNGTF